MIYFMDGKTFIKDFVRKHSSLAKKAKYVIVSSTIRKIGKYEDSVINMNNALFPSNELIMDYADYKHNEEYADKYMEQLEDSKAFFATLIMYDIKLNKDKNKHNVIFLCGNKERKYFYFNLIQKYVEDEFGYHIVDYRKFIKKKKDYKFPKLRRTKDILATCKKIRKKKKAEQQSKLIQSENGRMKLLKEMTKKKLRKELKKRDLYINGMSKGDMIDMLKTIL